MEISWGSTTYTNFILLNASFTSIIIILQTNLQFLYLIGLCNSLQLLLLLPLKSLSKYFFHLSLISSFFKNTLWSLSSMHLTQFKSLLYSWHNSSFWIFFSTSFVPNLLNNFILFFDDMEPPNPSQQCLLVGFNYNSLLLWVLDSPMWAYWI